MYKKFINYLLIFWLKKITYRSAMWYLQLFFRIEPDMKMGLTSPFRYNHHRYMAAAAAAAAAAATAATAPTNGNLLYIHTNYGTIIVFYWKEFFDELQCQLNDYCTTETRFQYREPKPKSNFRIGIRAEVFFPKPKPFFSKNICQCFSCFPHFLGDVRFIRCRTQMSKNKLEIFNIWQ